MMYAIPFFLYDFCCCLVLDLAKSEQAIYHQMASEREKEGERESASIIAL